MLVSCAVNIPQTQRGRQRRCAGKAKHRHLSKSLGGHQVGRLVRMKRSPCRGTTDNPCPA
jgi:hypothetical protein